MTSTRATTARPLRSARSGSAVAAVSPIAGRGHSSRQLQRDLYAAHLRAVPSAAGDLYSAQTVDAYLTAIDQLGRWLDATGATGGYLDLTTADLDAYFADYRKSHTQGGANTRQRRLHTFYGWLVTEVEPGRVNPMAGVTRYAASEPPPKTYAGDFVTDVLATCTDRADFEDVRDEAILRLLASTGMRRGELAGLHVEDVDLASLTVQVSALKGTRKHAPVLRHEGGREVRAGRVIPIGSQTALALSRWLTVRARHKLVRDPASGPLWYSSRGRGRLTGNGVWRMVKRRAEGAGYDPAEVDVHGFRHTRSDQLLASGEIHEGEVMDLMGWTDREMVDRYAANRRTARAHASVRRAGLVS